MLSAMSFKTASPKIMEEVVQVLVFECTCNPSIANILTIAYALKNKYLHVFSHYYGCRRLDAIYIVGNCHGPCYLVVRTFERLLMDVNVTDSMGSIAPPKCSIRRNRGKENEKQERMTERN